MRLIGMLDSPFVRRVAVTLELLGVAFRHEALSVFSTFNEFQRINPVVKAPTLVLDDGTVLMDSSLIISYLESRLATGQALWSRDATERAHEYRAVALALDYRKAVMDGQKNSRHGRHALPRAILAETPASRIALRILIDQLSAGPDPAAALPEIERALALEPDALDLHVAKLRILAQSGDSAGTGAQLKTMVERFPDNTDARSALIAWYMSEGDIDGAEAFMRQLAGDPTGPVEGHIAVVQLLQATRGIEAAKAELGRLIAANDGTTNADLYRALDATFDFGAGKHDEAIAALETIIKAASPSDQTRRIKIMLAKMLEATGNRVGARASIEEVLAEDVTNVEALKMRAGWLIEEDRPGEAIVDLRAALGQAPRDAAILTLMAAAHERGWDALTVGPIWLSPDASSAAVAFLEQHAAVTRQTYRLYERSF